MTSDPAVPILEVLEGTPAVKERSKRLLESLRPALEATSELPGAARVRLAEHVLASGAGSAALQLVESAVGEELDVSARAAATYVQATVTLLVSVDHSVPKLHDLTELALLRRGMLEALAARLDGRMEAACAHWEAVAAQPGGSVRAEELRIEALTAAGRVRYVAGDSGCAGLFEQAASLCQQWGCAHDEAALLTWRLLAAQRHGSTEEAMAIGERARLLPIDGPGLPLGVRARLEAATLASAGQIREAVRCLDGALAEALSSADAVAFAGVSVAKSGVCEAVDEPYQAWRTVRLAEARLARWDGAGHWHELVARARHTLELKAGVSALEVWNQRLGEELRR